MSSGDPIFLVSMCGTPEEFLAAFRRYVDRHGLFTPTATPAPALHHGRFAITLADGSVMIEGEAEVASSSPRPSALYGRTGMTLHFTAVDEPSKQVLAALDKAKLSIKVTSQAAGLQPRPSRLAEPVQHPPARVGAAAADKTLALAECVVVGDLAALTPGRAGAKGAAARPGPRFAIPPIGPTGSAAAAAPAAAQARPLVQQEAGVSTQTGVPPAPGGTPTLSAPPVPTTPMRSPAVHQAMDDGPSEATEVGPIVEEAIIQPSGPTLTTTAVIVSAPPPPEASAAPLPPEALAAAAVAGVKVPLDEELETTLGGPPPMPPGAPPPMAHPPTPAARTPLGPAGPRPGTGTGGVPSIRNAGELSGGSARPATAPLASHRNTPAMPTVPAIAPLTGRTSAPAIPAAPPGSLSGPVASSSSHLLKNGNGTLSSPVVSPLGGPASGPVAAASASSTLSGATHAAPSGPTKRPSAHVIRNGPARRPSAPAISPASSSTAIAAAPAAAAAVTPRSAPTRQSTPAVAPPRQAPAAQKLDGADLDLGNRGDRNSERIERPPGSPIRRTVIGIAATHIEPAPPAAPLSEADAAAVPEAVHDSMFVEPEVEPETAAAEAGSSSRTPLPSFAKPGRASTSQLPPVPSRPPTSRPPSAPGRFGRASESVAAAPPDLDEGWGDAPASSPRRMPAPPSQSTVSMRPPIAAPGSGPVITAASSPALGLPASPGSGAPGATATPPSVPFAAPSTVAPAAPSGSLAAALAAPSAAPSAVDEAFATVPTIGPSPGSSGPRPLGGMVTRPPSERSGPLARLSSIPSISSASSSSASSTASSAARPVTGGPHLGALDHEITESIDTDDPDDPVFGPAIGPPSPAASRPALPPPVLRPFSDTASVSEPLEVVSPPRPPSPFEAARAAGSSNGLAATPHAAPADPGREAPLLEAARAPSLAPAIPPAAASADADIDVDLDGAEALGEHAGPEQPVPGAPGDDGAHHARARQLAMDAKVEIDPALYAESVIDQSFEANFVLPGSEAPPPSWQPQQWDPASAGIAMPPPPAQQSGYGYPPPENSYPPGYDMAFPQAYHSGDETALVMAPDVGRRRTFVIVGSAILVLLAGLGIYLFLDRAKHRETSAPAQPSVPALKTTGDSPEGAAPDDPMDKDDTNKPPGAAADSAAGGELGAGAGTGEPAAAAVDCEVPVESSPGGAVVLAAGEELGTTPFTATLPCKLVTLTFRKEGFAEVTQELSPTAKGKPFSVTLEPAATITEKGSGKADPPVKMVDIEISATPSNAQIKVGDRELPRGTRKASVPAGVELTVTISKGGKTASKSFTPTASNRKISLALKRGRGSTRKSPSGGQSANSLDDL